MKNTVKQINTMMKDYSFKAQAMDKNEKDNLISIYEKAMLQKVGSMVNLQDGKAVAFISSYHLIENFKAVLKEDLDKDEAIKNAQRLVISYAYRQVASTFKTERQELKALRLAIVKGDLVAVNEHMQNCFGCSVAQSFIDFMQVNLLKGDKVKSDSAFIKELMAMFKAVQTNQGCYSEKKAKATIKAVTKELKIYGVEKEDAISNLELKEICELAKIDGLLCGNYIHDIKLLSKAEKSVLVMTKAELEALNRA